jgi:hypothetical protein
LERAHWFGKLGNDDIVRRKTARVDWLIWLNS